ncbi:hypothetical protein DL93DRAFT_2096485 [Clavulina sp. PMI_390]|nr:hypothetical protein DL93DRAFT_2096485 [Clavulina sp. PMI_390]
MRGAIFAFILSLQLVHCRETLEDAAKNVRSLLATQSIGTLASVYPDLGPSSSYAEPLSGYAPPQNLAGHAFALPEYYAPCFPNNGSLLLIMFRISQNAKNILAKPNPSVHSTDDNIQTPLEWSEGDEDNLLTTWKTSGQATFIVQELPLSPSPVTKPRVSLMGNLTLLSDDWMHVRGTHSGDPSENQDGDDSDELAECYLSYHPDSKWWIPGRGAFHDVAWARFDPEAVYYVGGFGGTHYIGYIPLDLYQKSG